MVVGIIAGRGALPQILYKHLKSKNTKVAIAFIGNSNFQTRESEAITANFGEVGKIINFFKKSKVTDIVLIGGVTKPKFSELKLDFQAGLLLSKILKNKLLGDNALLSTVISFLEQKSFQVKAINDFLPELLAQPGDNCTIKCPKKLINKELSFGQEVINSLADYDIGQAIVTQNNRVLAVEAAEGTDAMLKRVAEFIDKDHKQPALLFKLSKKNQDRRVDLPTIGTNTIKLMLKYQLKGLIIEAHNSLIVNKDEVFALAATHKIFIYAV